MLPQALRVVQIVAGIFDALDIAYLVGGSIASSLHGLSRSTQDVDFVAEMRAEHITLLANAMQAEFYIDEDMIRDALATHSSFNVLHLPTMVKVDVFIFQANAWEKEEWARRRKERIGVGEEEKDIYFASAEDMILQKLMWYRLGGGVSDRQWGDVTGMVKVQAEVLDYAYLGQWAASLDLADLLQKVYEEAGVREEPS